MARKKNATFTGVQWTDSIPGAATYQRAIENVAGDVALIFDKLTGQHSHAAGETINHDGTAGNGARLRMPYVNQHFGGRTLKMTSPNPKGSNGGLNDFYILAAPIFIPPGEDSIHVRVDGSFILDDVTNAEARVIITDTSRTEIANEPLFPWRGLNEDAGITHSYTATLNDLNTGLHLIFVQMTVNDTAANSDIGRIDSWTVTPTALTGSGARGANFFGGPRLFGTKLGIRTPGTSGVTLGVNCREYDEALFYAEAALHAYLTQGLNYDINGLFEYLTGSAVAGNATYEQVDHDGGGSADAVNPARSRFFAHTAASYSTEPRVAFPLMSAAMGAIGTDGNFAVDPTSVIAPPTVGMLDFHAPWPIATSTQPIWSCPLIWPDFDTSTNNLKGAVLLGSNGRTTVNNWTVNLLSDVGSNTNLGAPTAIDGNNDFWLATGSALSLFNSSCPDSYDSITVRTSRSGVKGSTDEIAVLGLCLYFEP